VKFIKSESPAKPDAVPVSTESPISATPAPSPTALKPLPKAPPPTESAAKPGPVPFNKEEFKNDPLIRKALEVFKGQIVDVRS
jgi:DNA polymerase-3 subunit gamma/tau